MADPIPCPTTFGTYQELLNRDATGGCTISVGGAASLTFSNFAFSHVGNGTPAAGASGISYTLDDPGVGSVGQPIFGFDFEAGSGLAMSSSLFINGPDSNSIFFSYLVVPTGATIDSVDLLENATRSGAALGEVTENLKFCIASDPNNTSGTCRTFPTPVTVSTPASLASHVTFGNWTSMSVSENIMAIENGGIGDSATITGVRDAVDLSTVPEPATFGLVGVGLLAIGYFSRRRRTAPR